MNESDGQSKQEMIEHTQAIHGVQAPFGNGALGFAHYANYLKPTCTQLKFCFVCFLSVWPRKFHGTTSSSRDTDKK